MQNIREYRTSPTWKLYEFVNHVGNLCFYIFTDDIKTSNHLNVVASSNYNATWHAEIVISNGSSFVVCLWDLFIHSFELSGKVIFLWTSERDGWGTPPTYASGFEFGWRRRMTSTIPDWNTWGLLGKSLTISFLDH